MCTHAFQLVNFLVFLRHCIHSLILSLLKHPRPGSFLYHAQDFRRFHVEYFGDFTLHDQEIWVIDVELDGLEEVLQGLKGGFMAIEKVFGNIPNGDLSDVRTDEERVVGERTWRVTVI